MCDPVLEWYESPAATQPLASWDYGTVDEGTRSPPKRFFLYNNKGGVGAAPATDLRYTTLDDASRSEVGDVVTQRWLEVRIVTAAGTPVADPDGGFKPVGGSQASHKKDLSGFPLENGAYIELETRVTVPLSPVAGPRSFVQRVEFKFT